MTRYAFPFLRVVLMGGVVALAGCAMSTSNLAPEPGSSSLGAVQGLVHGGQNPVSGASVYVLEASHSAYAGPGMAASTGNQSKSLLSSTGTNTLMDGSGNYYVTSDQNGNFSIGGDYTCDANQVVYVYVVGGNSGSGVNSSIGMMSTLGVCPSGGGSLAALTPFVLVNEVSTVATAYALAGFATDAKHVGFSGTTLGLQGIQQAAANVKNILNVGTGTAYQQTPGSTTGNVGVVPYQTINTLANILASCINSTGSGSAACTTLFQNGESAGSSGTVASDTATVAINIAHNPGKNVSILYGLQTGTGVPFPSDLTSAPNDLTVAVMYKGGGMNFPFGLALDAGGNVWVTNQGNNTLSKFSPLGVAASTANGFAHGGLNTPTGLAIDSTGNVWVKNIGSTSVISEFSSAGVPVSTTGYSPAGFGNGAVANGIAFDANGYLWVTGDSGNSPIILQINATGSSIGKTAAGPFTGTHLQGGGWVAVDANNNVWTADGAGTVSEFSATTGASRLTGSQGTISGMTSTDWVTFDSGGNVWVVDNNSEEIAELNGANGGGAAVKATASEAGGLSYAFTVQVDAAGSVWTANYGNNSISQLTVSGTTISGASPSTGYLNPNPDSAAFPSIQAAQLDESGNVWAVDTDNVLIQWIGLAAPQSTPVMPTTYGARP